MNQKILFLLCVTTLSFSNLADAQFVHVRSNTFDIHGFVGTLIFDDIVQLDNSVLLGVRGTYNFTERLAIEGTFGITPTEVVDGTESVNVLITHGSLVFSFPSSSGGRLLPFLLAGGGFTHFDFENSSDIINELSLEFGGGIKYFFSERGFFRVDVRDLFIPERDLLQDSDESLNNFEITGGLSYELGR